MSTATLRRPGAAARPPVPAAPLIGPADDPFDASGEQLDAEGHPELLGQVVADHRLERILGTGGFGRVYRGRHLATGAVAAVKVLRDLLKPVSLRRFERGTGLLARLRHPGIVAIRDAGHHRGHPYLVMELVDGESLAARLARARTLDAAEARRIVLVLARTLDHVHGHGVIHRDIKPGNVLLARDGAVLLTDFDLARPLEDAGDEAARVTREGSGVGTVAYMAPEQLRGLPTDERSDVWALGALYYELLEGAPPFGAGSPAETARRIVTERPHPLASAVRASAEAALILEMLARDPAHRPPTMAEVIARAERGPTTTAARAATPRRLAAAAPRRPRRSSEAVRAAAVRPSDAIGAPSARPSDAIRAPTARPSDAVRAPSARPSDAVRAPAARPSDAIRAAAGRPSGAFRATAARRAARPGARRPGVIAAAAAAAAVAALIVALAVSRSGGGRPSDGEPSAPAAGTGDAPAPASGSRVAASGRARDGRDGEADVADARDLVARVRACARSGDLDGAGALLDDEDDGGVTEGERAHAALRWRAILLDLAVVRRRAAENGEREGALAGPAGPDGVEPLAGLDAPAIERLFDLAPSPEPAGAARRRAALFLVCSDDDAALRARIEAAREAGASVAHLDEEAAARAGAR